MPTPSIILPLWPRAGLAESLEWRTDVMITEDGSEDRTELRSSPRQQFRQTCFVAPAWQAQINNLLYGGRDQQWWVPAWPQVQNIGAVAGLADHLTAETRYSDFRAGGYVLLWESIDHYQVAQIDSVTSDTNIDLIDSADEFANAWLMPLRIGHLDTDPVRRFDGRKSEIDLAFNIADNLELSPTAPTQYLGLDLYTDPGLLDGGQLMGQLVARVDQYDEGLGPISYLSPWTSRRPSRVHRMMGEDAAEMWAIREFLHRRKGRSVAFWQPTFEADLRPNDTGAVTTSLIVRPDGYQTYAAARDHIAIQKTDGTWLPRAVTARTVLSADELQLDLDTSLGGFDASLIDRVCFLGQKRLDTDRAELNYIGNTVGTCAVNIVEIEP